MKSLNKYADVEVIAPIPWFPLIKINRPRGIPFKEKIGKLIVYHPRFFSIPKLFKSLDGIFFSFSLRRFKKKIKKVDIIAYEDLGPEALRRLEVENFPVIVANDCLGGDLFKEGAKKYHVI